MIRVRSLRLSPSLYPLISSVHGKNNLLLVCMAFSLLMGEWTRIPPFVDRAGEHTHKTGMMIVARTWYILLLLLYYTILLLHILDVMASRKRAQHQISGPDYRIYSVASGLAAAVARLRSEAPAGVSCPKFPMRTAGQSSSFLSLTSFWWAVSDDRYDRRDNQWVKVWMKN